MNSYYDDSFIDDTLVEPDIACKIGPFSCFCLCTRRTKPAYTSAGTESRRAYGRVQTEEIVHRGHVDDDGIYHRRTNETFGNDMPFTRREASSDSTRSSFVYESAGGLRVVLDGSSAPSRAPEVYHPAEETGLVGEAVAYFREAVIFGSDAQEVSDLMWRPFLDGVEAFARGLNALKLGSGAKMGDEILRNTRKLRDAKTDDSLPNYSQWLLSEIETHAVTKYQSYVDDSAFMGNLWIGRTLEFFVEMLDLMEKYDVQDAAKQAYDNTLSTHHNLLIRMRFKSTLAGLPHRKEVLQTFGAGKVDEAGVEREIRQYVELARPAALFCYKMNDLADKEVQARKNATQTGFFFS